jgi:hypothetical protein
MEGQTRSAFAKLKKKEILLVFDFSKMWRKKKSKNPM